MNRNICFTVLIGEGDTLKQPKIITEGWSYVAITDQIIDNPGAWTIVKPDPAKATDSKKLSRYYKIRYDTKQYDTNIYIDCTYQIEGDLNEFIVGLPEGGTVYMTAHPQRNCVYAEARIVLDKKLDSKEVVNKQIERYHALKYPIEGGLYRCGVIVRRGDTKSFDKIWWNEVDKGSWRDQISAPFAAFWSSTKITEIPHGHVERFFGPRLHNPRKIPTSKIINCSTKEEVKVAPKDSWINWRGFPDAVTEIEKHPYTPHLIVRGESMLYQRWLSDYLPEPSEMLKQVKIYRGKFIEYINV